jgi:TonB family protein
MPLTEAPPPETTGSEEEKPRRSRRGRASRLGVYDDLGGYDLLHVIEDLEDERARVQLREKIWIALILHLLLFAWIYWAPKYIWHVKVREAPLNQKQDMTVLTLPPDLLKQLQPKKPAPLSDKNRQQQSAKPTPDQKTLRELERMRRAGPPVRVPAPEPQQAPKPQTAPPQMARAAAPPAPQPKATPPPLAPNPNSQLNAPKPRPNFSTPQQTPGQAIEQAERQARSAGSYGGDMGANAPLQHPGNKGAVDILSDTLGVNFGPYIQRVIYDTKRSWYPIIPEVARPPISKQGRVLIRFKIMPDGSVKSMTLEGPSGDVALDRAAWGGILGASPFPPLPKNFKGPFLELRFYFLYNDGIGQ